MGIFLSLVVIVTLDVINATFLLLKQRKPFSPDGFLILLPILDGRDFKMPLDCLAL